MFDYCSLQELIDRLEKNSRFHISVLFMSGKFRNSRLLLEQRSIIHSSPFCNAMKNIYGHERCMRCKAAAVNKALRTRKAYSGLCINGIFEYCHPVVIGDGVVCVIFIGNIVTDPKKFNELINRHGLSELKETVEYSCATDEYAGLAQLIESYIRMLIELYPQKDAFEQLNPAVEMLKGYIDNYFRDNVSLGQVAAIYHYNQKYLGRLFKKEMGLSFNDYLNKRRLEYAGSRLKSTESRIVEIALEAGFNSVTYFNRLFVRYFGCTPTDHRANYR